MFREIPRRGWALVADVIAVSATATAAGAAALFVGLVFFGAVAEEGFFGVWSDFDLDPVWRAGIGAAGITVLAAAGVAALFTGLSKLAVARRLADAAERDRDRVAAWSVRRVLERGDPFEAFVGFAVLFLILDVLGLVVTIFALAETMQHNADGAAEGFAVLAVLLGAGLITLLLLLAWRGVWRSAWDEHVVRARQVWNVAIPRAIDAERRRRGPVAELTVPRGERLLRSIADRGWRVFGGLGGAAGAVFLVALYLRQPCRECDERRYDHAGEAIIDVLARIAGPTAIVAVLGLGLSLIALWIAEVRQVSRLAALAASGTPAPPPEQLTAVLTGVWPGRSAGTGLVAIGWGGAAVATGVLLAGVATIDWLAVLLPLAALGALGVVVLAASESHAVRVRNRLREAWSPGDVRPPEPEPERESAAMSGTE